MTQKMLMIYSGDYIGSDNKRQKYDDNYDSVVSMSKAFVTDYILAGTTNTTVWNAANTSTYSQRAEKLATIAEVVARASRGFYIGLPPVNDLQKLGTGNYSTEHKNIKTFLSTVKSALNSKGVWNSCKGFYWTSERIPESINPNSLLSNTYVALLNDVAYDIRNSSATGYYKEFIWSPYMGFNSMFYTINQIMVSLLTRQISLIPYYSNRTIILKRTMNLMLVQNQEFLKKIRNYVQNVQKKMLDITLLLRHHAQRLVL